MQRSNQMGPAELVSKRTTLLLAQPLEKAFRRLQHKESGVPALAEGPDPVRLPEAIRPRVRQ